MKKHQKSICGFIVIIAGLLMTSCTSKNDPWNEVEYLPFQESKDGNWGLISIDGEVLFSDEFKNEPTMAVNGRFMVKNSDGLWEIYTAEKKPKKIGGEYLQAGMFYEDVAPVVEKGKPIQFIDRDGNVKVTLDKIDGKAVTKCTQFYGGLATVEVGDYLGAVDTDGDVVISPEYIHLRIDCDGRSIALHKKYENKDKEDYVYTVFDRKGKEIGSVKGAKIAELRYIRKSYRNNDHCIGDAVVVGTSKDNEIIEGILGFDGEWVLKPSKKITMFHEIQNGILTYSTDDGLGLTNLDGDILIRPKFANLGFLDEKILCGKKSKKDDYALYNFDGEQIGKDEYEEIFTFHSGVEYTIAKVGDGDYVLLNRKGEEKQLKGDVYKIEGMGAAPDFVFESDFVDVDDVVSALDITNKGFMGLTMDMKAWQAIGAINRIPGLEKTLSADAKKYAGERSIWSNIKIRKLWSGLETNISGLVIRSQRRNGWWTTTNYDWSGDKAVPGFNIHFDLEGNPSLEGKTHDLYEAIKKAVTGVGKVVKSGKNAVVVETDKTIYYYAYWSGGRVALYYGTYDIDSIDVESFDDASEEKPGIILQPGRTLERIPEVDTDSVEVVDPSDTIAVDYD